MGQPNNNISKLVINEIVTSNDGVYSSEDGSICDFIELYNGNNYDINLKKGMKVLLHVEESDEGLVFSISDIKRYA